ncbi:hypothetical protein [Streptomyces griseosporeus]|uniref:hypothetical protein n=1 Tax=Streptomyces griseosporeus TaxID=1910 RepID=UPI00167E1BFD|nr:hypothetical protein [Streptomyces griseosporeus]GHF57719.1 hypothetical protein GCM10018783_28870 [Streptomyces griseosporeus]
MTSHVEQQVQARIAAARAKGEADKQRRQELAEARQRGLAARHAQKLRHQGARRGALNDLTAEEIAGPVGYLAACLAQLRTGHGIAGLDTGLVSTVPPTQADADNARLIASAVRRMLAAPLKPLGCRPAAGQSGEGGPDADGSA